jgi:hypothetical protein
MDKVDGTVALCWVCPFCEDNNKVELKSNGSESLTGWSMTCECQTCLKKYEVHAK